MPKPKTSPPPTLVRAVPRLRDPQKEWERREALREAIRSAVNSNSIENETDTPDWILADYLIRCLYVFERTINARAKAAKEPTND